MKKPFIKEYRDLTDSDRSIVTILKQGIVHTIKHHTEGYECAGSCSRHTNEKWSVTRVFDNAIHGKTFINYEQAIEYFNKFDKKE